MKIDFKKLIENSGEQISMLRLAKDMTSQGLFRSVQSAYNCIWYHNTGRAKTIDLALLEYLSERFKLTTDKIIKP